YDPYQAAAAAVPAAPAADRWPAQPPAGREAAYGGRDYDDYDRDPREAPAPPRPSAARVDPSERPWLDMDGHGYPLLSALTVLGRDPHVDITLEDAGISRRHAEIRVTHDGPHFAISVRDLGSTNGTFVNGDRITSQHVTDGDRITLGRTSLVIRSGRR
ncbi:FHA domain-containing protein, partial [Austwickia chelonae]